jgi:poly(3-hydroxybutyrate) depolymerase
MSHPLCLSFVALLFALVGASLSAAPLPAGPGKIEFPTGPEPITLFTYKPPTYKDGPLLVVFHGVGRNAEEYRNYAITLAERYSAIVVAPLFDKDRFPSLRYQRGGLLTEQGQAQPSEAWTYAFIPKIVAHVRGRGRNDGLGQAAHPQQHPVQRPAVHVLHQQVDLAVGVKGPVKVDD